MELIRDIRDLRQSSSFQSKLDDDENGDGGDGCSQTLKIADHPGLDLHLLEDRFLGNDLRMGELPMDC
jgi:hypothetical protein